MGNLKLAVEVVRAHNLLPKDGQGSSSPFVEVHFDGQKCRTSTKEKDLDPHWNETFYFNVSNPESLRDCTLEAHVYSSNSPTTASKSSLGKVLITATSFVPQSEAAVFNYPLEKASVFSRAKGELALKVYRTEDPNVKASSPFVETSPARAEEAGPLANGKKGSRRRSFFSLGRDPPHQAGSSVAEDQRQENDPEFSHMMSEPHHPSPFVYSYAAGPSSSSSSRASDFLLKETSPFLGGGQVIGGRVRVSDRKHSMYDLVEPMQFLFVRVVKAQELPGKDLSGGVDPYVEVKLGNYKGVTKHLEKNQSPEWNTVFAFSKDKIQSSVLEVVVRDKDVLSDGVLGHVRFDLHEVPTRVPPDSPLAPEWHRLENKDRKKAKGDLMVAVWFGTQADEAFPDAWHSDASVLTDSSVPCSHIRSKVYLHPKLWYVRVNVIEAQDLVLSERNGSPSLLVRAQLGSQLLKTRPVQPQSSSAWWNEDLMLVAAEPFDEHLVLTVEDRAVGPNKDEVVVGRVVIPLASVERRLDDRTVHSRWYSVQRSHSSADAEDEVKKDKFSSRIHLRVSIDGGYHVLDESTHYSSDLRPSARQLWKPPVGTLDLGILNALGLVPTKTRNGRGVSDAYCVAKYGHKWVRTRTIADSLNPKYNEQYSWDVYDPATVITVGVFDNGQIGDKGSVKNGRDSKIGKVRIRISTLEAGRIYTHSYPLLVLHPSGVKKMGELHLAIRFTCASTANMMSLYSKPLLPKMHYKKPLAVAQLEALRHQAASIVAARLSRAEPPLRKEVTEYMSDADSHLWSMRRSKANFFRLMSVFHGVAAAYKWFDGVRTWKNPVTTALVHVLFAMLVCYPELILPTAFLYMFAIGLWNYRFRPTYPPHMDTRLSFAEAVHPDELDEEFDTFPTSRSPDVVRMRYDRLRSVAGRIQVVVGDIASQGERVQALLSWRDPRATVIYMVFCVVAAFVLYSVPFRVLAALSGFYVMRHPRFRQRLPSSALNFFRRLPARTDSML